MTTREFSQQFNILLNSFKDFKNYGLTIGQIITLNEYEKSVYLSLAQESIVLELVTGVNNTRDSFEKNESVRRYLQPLVKSHSTTQTTRYDRGVSSGSQFFSLENLQAEDVWYIIFENAKLKTSNRITEVKPIPHSEITKVLNNPFRNNPKRVTLRLDVSDFTDKIVELINPNIISEYFFRYLKKPSPIILEDFEEVSINGIKNITECELHESLHVRILGKAYELALQAYVTARGSSPTREQNDNNKN